GAAVRDRGRARAGGSDDAGRDPEAARSGPVHRGVQGRGAGGLPAVLDSAPRARPSGLARPAPPAQVQGRPAGDRLTRPTQSTRGDPMNHESTNDRNTLVLSGTGKTGRRVVERLEARGLPLRVGSRSGTPPFDWEKPETWEPALEGVGAVYLTY